VCGIRHDWQRQAVANQLLLAEPPSVCRITRALTSSALQLVRSRVDHHLATGHTSANRHSASYVPTSVYPSSGALQVPFGQFTGFQYVALGSRTQRNGTQRHVRRRSATSTMGLKTRGRRIDAVPDHANPSLRRGSSIQILAIPFKIPRNAGDLQASVRPLTHRTDQDPRLTAPDTRAAN